MKKKFSTTKTKMQYSYPTKCSEARNFLASFWIKLFSSLPNFSSNLASFFMKLESSAVAFKAPSVWFLKGFLKRKQLKKNLKKN